MNDLNGPGFMFVRLAIQYAGVALAARGYGDEALWQAIGGALLTAAGATWSWFATRKPR